MEMELDKLYGCLSREQYQIFRISGMANSVTQINHVSVRAWFFIWLCPV